MEPRDAVVREVCGAQASIQQKSTKYSDQQQSYDTIGGSHYVGLDRQSHDFDQGMVTPGPIVGIPSSC
jgi:hypothetical protein